MLSSDCDARCGCCRQRRRPSLSGRLVLPSSMNEQKLDVARQRARLARVATAPDKEAQTYFPAVEILENPPTLISPILTALLRKSPVREVLRPRVEPKLSANSPVRDPTYRTPIHVLPSRKSPIRDPPPRKSPSPQTIPKQSVISVYPAMFANVRWNPYVKKKEIPIPNRETDEEYLCDPCTSSNCPSGNSVDNIKPKYVFKDNIVTYCDRYTMTPTVVDGSCNARRYITYEDEPIATSQSRYLPKKIATALKCPPPILKKAKDRKQWSMEAVRDTDADDYADSDVEFSRSSAPMKLPKFGISDRSNSTERCSDEPEIARLLKYVDKEMSTKCVDCSSGEEYCRGRHCRSPQRFSAVRCEPPLEEGYIPYSHKHRSRYHRGCLEHGRVPEELYQFPKMNLPRRPPLSVRSPSPSPCTGSFHLPRRMLLTSEKNIDSFIKVSK